MIGDVISHYRVLEKLGSGGMGVVYKAEDTKLKRLVALKFLTSSAVGTGDDKTRFVREAQAAAALSHPNIATVYEINECDRDSATAKQDIYIVMEFIEGQDLKQKIESGPLKISEAIKIAQQIADGLHAAHEKGIVHRDIKSANIMLDEKGRAKIMDFGLAKLSSSSTLTKKGTTLGTVDYMSPEQTTGEKVDHRTDIWSLGVILYEMISGSLPFKGEYDSAKLYSIINEEPEPLTAIRTGVPMEVERIVNKLLAKDPEDRYQNIIELPVDLKAIDLKSNDTVKIAGSMNQKQIVKQNTISWKTASLLVVLTAVTFSIITWLLKPDAGSEPVRMFTHSLLQGETLSSLGLTISPDGNKLVYCAISSGARKLYLRKIDQLEAIPLDDTEGAIRPFFSADSKELYFFADAKLKKLIINGGTTQTLCSLPSASRGGTCGDDGTIIFACDGKGLFRVSAKGGIPENILEHDTLKIEIYYRFPKMLPGSKSVLYTAWEGGNYDEANICVLSLETGKSDILITGGTNPVYTTTGHILFGRKGSCWAVSFDAVNLEITGQAVPVQEAVNITAGLFGGDANLAVSTNGIFVYTPESASRNENALVLVDRNGVETPLSDRKRSYGHSRISPDGAMVATSINEENIYTIWILDIARGTQTLLDSDGSINRFATWSPDSKSIIFQSNISGVINLYGKSLSGIGEAKPVFTSKYSQFGGSWSNDGRLFAFCEIPSLTGADIWVYNSKDSTATPFIKTPNHEHSPAFSPDGKWIAYVSDKTGIIEVYITPYPGPGRHDQVSTKGGNQVRWAPDGGELFFRNGDKMMAVAVETKPYLKLGNPKLLFEKPYLMNNANITFYDIHPDRDHFLMIKGEYGLKKNHINVVLNWFEVLKEKMSAAEN